MQDFVAIDFETPNERRSSVDHHALAEAEACAAIALKIL